MDDQQIIREVLGGDVEAFRTLVEQHQSRLFSLLGNLLTVADSEDIAQETFLAAYDNLAHYDPARSLFSTWLLTIARNKCMNHLQKKRARTVATLPEVVVASTPETELEDQELRRCLDKALAELPAQQQMIFVLIEFEQLSYEEVSRIEGLKIGTVKSRLSRARQQLRALLSEDDR